VVIGILTVRSGWADRVASKSKKPAGESAGGLWFESDFGRSVEAVAVRRHDRLMMMVVTMMEVALHLELRL